LVADVVAGASRVAVLRGEAGVGKSALLAYLRESTAGWRVSTVVGVESELELAYSGLHQLCVPMLDHLERLPAPQRDALATVFGMSAGSPPDRFLVGLATLTLLADAAEQQPLLCIVDDAQWLDQESAQVFGFVGRRLLAERVALVAAVRTGSDEHVLGDLPDMTIQGLDERDARTLLLESVPGPVDAPVFDQILAECHGNPLALLELPRARKPAELAGGFALLDGLPVPGRIEQTYVKRLHLLPPETRLLVLAAAAEPLGDPVLLHRAAEILGVDMAVADPAIDAGLLELRAGVGFAHPLVRSAAYRASTFHDRQRVHLALAEATDAKTDPDRRAWHRAHAALLPDEAVAAELEHSANRARERGGIAASAAFLARASELSPEPRRRAERALTAAGAKRLAGLSDDAADLLTTATRGPLGARDAAVAQRLRGQLAFDGNVLGDAARLLLDAAAQLETLDVGLARDAYLEALLAASTAGRLGRELVVAAEAARAAPPAPQPGPMDLILDGLAVLFADGFEEGAPILRRALAMRREILATERGSAAVRIPARVAAELLDDETWEFLTTRQIEAARANGHFEALPVLLGYLGTLRIHEGNLQAAEAVLVEAEAIGSPAYLTRLMLAAYRGDETTLTALRDVIEPPATAQGHGVILAVCAHAASVLHNALGRYEDAREAARQASDVDELNLLSWGLPELIEAAVRSDEIPAAIAAHERLASRARASRTELAAGFEARSRALISEGSEAEAAFGEAIELLGRTRLHLHRARAHLLYGEWLRRDGRRADAREQLRAAHELFNQFGAHGFAERARRELLATGETVRARTNEARDDLTPQELEIARLAASGHTNPEIGGQLFLSPRTVEWHLRKVYTKLDIRSRRQLRAALPERTLSVANV
jgi:DNA-binding CsgD family transcriptional regulator